MGESCLSMFPSKPSPHCGYLKFSLISTISLLFVAHVFIMLQNVILVCFLFPFVFFCALHNYASTCIIVGCVKEDTGGEVHESSSS